MEKIGKRIAEIRKSLGLTQQALADKIDGATVQMICSYENDKQMPSLKTLTEISKKLDVSLDYLVFGEEKRQDLRNRSENDCIYDICYMIYTLEESGYIHFWEGMAYNKKGYDLFTNDKAICNFLDQYFKVKETRQILGEKIYHTVIENILKEVSQTKYE